MIAASTARVLGVAAGVAACLALSAAPAVASDTVRLVNKSNQILYSVGPSFSSGSCNSQSGLTSNINPGGSASLTQTASPFGHCFGSQTYYAFFGLYAPQSQQLLFGDHDPVIGDHTPYCAMVGYPATVLTVTLSGNTCTISGNAPGSALVNARFATTGVSVRDGNALVQVALYGRGVAGRELVTISDRSGQTLGHASTKLFVGDPATVSVPLAPQTLAALARSRTGLVASASIRPAPGTRGTGQRLRLVLR